LDFAIAAPSFLALKSRQGELTGNTANIKTPQREPSCLSEGFDGTLVKLAPLLLSGATQEAPSGIPSPFVTEGVSFAHEDGSLHGTQNACMPQRIPAGETADTHHELRLHPLWHARLAQH
jgi:hypothetical protein